MNTENIIEFIMDPLRLTLIVAGVVVLLAILIFGRRSSKQRSALYSGSPNRDFSFGSPPADDLLVDEEVRVLPPRKKESDLVTENAPRFNAFEEPKREQEPIIETFEAIVETPMPATENNIQNTTTPVVDDSYSAPTTAKSDSVSKSFAKPEIESKVEAAAVKAETASEPVSDAPQPKQQFVVLHIIAAESQPFSGSAILDATQNLGMAIGKHNVFHYPADAAYVGDSAFCLVNMSAEGNFDTENLSGVLTNGVSLIMTLPTKYSDGLTVFSNMLAVAHALSKKLGGDIIDQTRIPLTADLVTSIRGDILKFEEQARQQSPALEIE